MIDAIFTHRSIRKFREDAIPEEVMNQLLMAGSRASTTGNMQVYSIIVSTEADIKEALWKAHFRQNMVLQAPVVLTFCADFNRFNKWCRMRKAEPGYDNYLSFFTGAIDALLAAQNVALEAVNQKLGICYLGTTTYNAGQIIDILGLPDSVVPVTTLVVGYPDENPPLTDRLPLRAIIHREKYQKHTEQEINEIYSERENSALTRELLEINQKETLAQIFTDKRYTKTDNESFSKAFLQTIAKQGFLKNIDKPFE